LLNLALGVTMGYLHYHSPKYNTPFAIISAIALGLTGLKYYEPERWDERLRRGGASPAS
jgi:hypothetical protein